MWDVYPEKAMIFNHSDIQNKNVIFVLTYHPFALSLDKKGYTQEYKEK